MYEKSNILGTGIRAVPVLVCLWKKQGSKKIKIFKIIIYILVIAICSCAVYYLFPVMKNISTPEGQIAFKEKITNSGIAGGLMLLGCIMLLIGLFIEPSGQIHSSVLIAFGEVGTLAASILGIDAIYTNKLQRIVSGMKGMSNDINELSAIDEPRT